MNKKLTFLVPFTVFFLYHITWLIYRFMNWHWDSGLNIPGFIMLILSYPWNYLYGNQELLLFLDHSIGYYSRALIMGALVSFGFAFNILVVVYAVDKLLSKSFNNTRKESHEKNTRIK